MATPNNPGDGEVFAEITRIAASFKLPDNHGIPRKYARLYEETLTAYFAEWDINKAIRLLEDFLEHFELTNTQPPQPCLDFILQLQYNIEVERSFAEKATEEIENIGKRFSK